MGFQRSWTGVVVMLLLLAGGVAAAQHASEPSEIDRAGDDDREQASSEEAKRSKFFGDVTVTATKTEVDPALSPVTSNTVDRVDIEDQPDQATLGLRYRS